MSDIHPADRDFLYFIAPLVELLEGYFDVTIEGLDKIPDGGAMLVGNHSGGIVIPDALIFLRRYLEHTQFEDMPVALAHDAMFEYPIFRKILCGAGAAPASRENAIVALEQGRKLLVYPGGDWETFRPTAERDKIEFAGRTGFVKIALATGAPIVPVVSAGGHDGWFILTRGDKIAHKLHLDKWFRVKVFPIGFAAPFGLLLGPMLPHIPLPSTIHERVLDPIHLSGSPDNSYDIEEGYRKVTDTMQAALNELASDLRQ